MIIQLNKQHTELSKLMEIPTTFFSRIESKRKFNAKLFPDWFSEVFGTTNNLEDGIYKKFERLFVKYKAIKDKNRRSEILNAYFDGIQIENLCNRVSGLTARKIDEFDEVKDELTIVFKHLWENSLQYHQFQTKCKTTVKTFVDDFIKAHHEISICPFCGLEGYMSLKGQSRLPLDHWMSKDKYPYSFVNFENLVPIGDKCNSSPAKGAKDILELTSTGRAFYPYTKHNSIKVEIQTTKVPTNPSEENGNYEIIVSPNNSLDRDIFDSWDSIFNINENYKSFLDKTLLNSWRAKYISFIQTHKILSNANNVNEFKINLEHWQGSFQPLILPGYLIFNAFIENLLSQPEQYLHGLMEYFKRQ